MVKYITTAVALKCFSSSALMRNLYRRLGNTVGNKRRSSGAMPDYYPERVKRMLRLQKQHNIVSNGDRILELGTGWLHWEALTTKLFFDIQAVLFDVWDNRQLTALKNYAAQLSPILLKDNLGLPSEQLERAQSLLRAIGSIDTFED